MGKRQTILREIVYRKFGFEKQPKPSAIEFQASQYWTQIEKIHKKLCGKPLTPTVRLGSWDVSTPDFIIELDEERHFNRYRLITLDMPNYQTKTNFNVDRYLAYCQKYEFECLKAARWGRNWKNPSTEKLFDESNGEGDFTMGGSSRWKQRAYYDFCKDVASRLMRITLLRISIYDSFRNRTVNDLLNTESKKDILDMIAELTIGKF